MSTRKSQSGKVTKQQVRDMISSSLAKESERKYWYTSTGTPSAPTSISSSGTFFTPLQVAAGTSNLTRVGNNAVVDELFMNLSLYADSTDGVNSFRVVIFEWTDLAGPTVASIFETTGNLINSYYSVNAIKTKKLRIIYDKKFTTGVTAHGPAQVEVRRKLNIPVQWPSTGTVDPIVGNTQLFVVSDSTAVTHPTMTGHITFMASQ